MMIIDKYQYFCIPADQSIGWPDDNQVFYSRITDIIPNDLNSTFIAWYDEV